MQRTFPVRLEYILSHGEPLEAEVRLGNHGRRRGGGGEIAVFREGGLSGEGVGLAGGGEARGRRYCNALTVNKVAL